MTFVLISPEITIMTEIADNSVNHQLMPSKKSITQTRVRQMETRPKRTACRKEIRNENVKYSSLRMIGVSSVGAVLIFNNPDLVNYSAVLIIGHLLNIQMREIVCFQTGIAVVLKLEEEKRKKKEKLYLTYCPTI
uniref:Uncharacterized protein n=1 Tax=Glossina pallidipes TaxID=7398 RepID=A0A1A9Z6C4_GLOPL